MKNWILYWIYITEIPKNRNKTYSIFIQFIKQKMVRKNGNKKIRYSWENRVDDTVFVFYRAIHIGRLWEFHRYDLRIETDKGKEIITEFTLRDIDEHGENNHTLIMSAIISALVSLFVAFITAFITKG